MASEVYVRSLFQLLHKLNIPQKAVIEHLGSSKPRASTWAAGLEPLPRRYYAAFGTFVDHAIAQALHASRERTTRHKGEATPLAAQAAFTLAETIDTALTAFEAECYDTLGYLQRDATRVWTTIKEIAGRCETMNQREIPNEDWRVFDQSVHALRRIRKIINLRDVEPTQADTWGVSPDFGAANPNKRFRQLWYWATGEVVSDYDEEDTE